MAKKFYINPIFSNDSNQYAQVWRIIFYKIIFFQFWILIMSNRFHLAVEAGDLSVTVVWYQEVLGCKLDRSELGSEEGLWQDVDFWGNELTLHSSTQRKAKNLDMNRHDVDMGNVVVPHFGVHLEMDQYQQVRENVLKNNGFLDKPYVRFEGTDYQQETFFVEDPNHNVLEIKHMVNPRES